MKVSVFFTLLVTFLFQPFALAAQNNEALPDLVTQWLELESQTGKLIVDWNSQKTLLDQKIELYQSEKSALEELIEKSNAKTDNIDEKRLALISEQEKLEKQQALTESAIELASSQFQQIYRRLPPPLKESGADNLKSLQDNALNTSERMESLLSLLKLLDEFDSRIAIHKAPLELNGKRIMVNQYYLGLSQAWYISDDGEYMGMGYANKTEWQWLDKNTLAQYFNIEHISRQILALKNISENPTQAKYIDLPVLANP